MCLGGLREPGFLADDRPDPAGRGLGQRRPRELPQRRWIGGGAGPHGDLPRAGEFPGDTGERAARHAERAESAAGP